MVGAVAWLWKRDWDGPRKDKAGEESRVAGTSHSGEGGRGRKRVVSEWCGMVRQGETESGVMREVRRRLDSRGAGRQWHAG